MELNFGLCYGMKAETIAAFARMTVEDSKKLLAPEYYPSWVVFSQKQKLSFICFFLFICFVCFFFIWFVYLSSGSLYFWGLIVLFNFSVDLA